MGALLGFRFASSLVITLQPEEALKALPSIWHGIFNIFTATVGTRLVFRRSKPDSLNMSHKDRAQMGISVTFLIRGMGFTDSRVNAGRSLSGRRELFIGRFALARPRRARYLSCLSKVLSRTAEEFKCRLFMKWCARLVRGKATNHTDVNIRHNPAAGSRPG